MPNNVLQTIYCVDIFSIHDQHIFLSIYIFLYKQDILYNRGISGMDDESIKEDWNMSLSYLYRIDNLLSLCDVYQTRDDVLNWYKVLYALYKEIYPKLRTKEKEEAKRMLADLTLMKRDALNNGMTIKIQPFVDFELYLRQMLEDRNMITPRKDMGGL